MMKVNVQKTFLITLSTCDANLTVILYMCALVATVIIVIVSLKACLMQNRLIIKYLLNCVKFDSQLLTLTVISAIDQLFASTVTQDR